MMLKERTDCAGMGILRVSLLLLLTLAVLPASSLAAQKKPSPIPRATAIKGSYLYYFAHYVTWPKKTRAPADRFVITVMGNAPLVLVLKKLSLKKKVRGKPLVIRTLRTLKDWKPCHILFIGKSRKSELARVRRLAERDHVLLVGDTPGFEKRGCTINFFEKNNNVRFFINLSAERKAGLKISSKLLNVAVIVRRLVKKSPYGARTKSAE